MMNKSMRIILNRENVLQVLVQMFELIKQCAPSLFTLLPASPISSQHSQCIIENPKTLQSIISNMIKNQILTQQNKHLPSSAWFVSKLSKNQTGGGKTAVRFQARRISDDRCIEDRSPPCEPLVAIEKGSPHVGQIGDQTAAAVW